jgi:hypothetical protein
VNERPYLEHPTAAAEASLRALREKMEAANMDPIKLATIFDRYLRLGVKLLDLAHFMQCHQSEISNYRRLLKLPQDVRDMVSRGELSRSGARALVPWANNPTVCRKLARQLTAGKLTSKEVERLWARSRLSQRQAAAPPVGLGNGASMAPSLEEADRDAHALIARHTRSGVEHIHRVLGDYLASWRNDAGRGKRCVSSGARLPARWTGAARRTGSGSVRRGCRPATRGTVESGNGPIGGACGKSPPPSDPASRNSQKGDRRGRTPQRRA